MHLAKTIISLLLLSFRICHWVFRSFHALWELFTGAAQHFFFFTGMRLCSRGELTLHKWLKMVSLAPFLSFSFSLARSPFAIFLLFHPLAIYLSLSLSVSFLTLAPFPTSLSHSLSITIIYVNCVSIPMYHICQLWIYKLMDILW